MKILLIEWDSYGRKDIKEAFVAEGHQLICFPFNYRASGLRHDPEVEAKLHAALQKETPDAVFSIDFFPVISKVCRREQIRYISWTCRMCCFIRRPSYIHAIPYMYLTGRCTRNFTVQAFLRFIICRLRRIPIVWMSLWKRTSPSPAIFHLWVLFMWKTII